MNTLGLKSIVLVVCLVSVTKNCEQVLVIFVKLAIQVTAPRMIVHHSISFILI